MVIYTDLSAEEDRGDMVFGLTKLLFFGLSVTDVHFVYSDNL
jgi:hypothetical protein